MLPLLSQAPEPNLFRHNVACTAERDGIVSSLHSFSRHFSPLYLQDGFVHSPFFSLGFLYSLNASTLSKQWESVSSILFLIVSSYVITKK
uniref:Uncharacterized protein n=1 Tax=Aegilops tauschii subsp. strangulata TaxID=200361 RepID=A0A453T4H9_AEGTS